MTLIRLADEAPFALGGVAVDPSSRTLAADGGKIVIEPRTMQVLVLLMRDANRVVGRQALIDACWEGRIVGEDAVNRAILKLRRSLDDVGGGMTVDTIARVGYRLNVVEKATDSPRTTVDRRNLILAGGGTVALAAIGGLAYLLKPRTHERSDQARELYDRGEIAFQQGSADDNAQAVGFFEQAAKLAPNDAPIAGALALAYRFEQTFRGPAVLQRSTARADAATARALLLDPKNPDAVAARSMYVPFLDHWLETERRLRAGLQEIPGSGVMNGFLGMVLADVGRTREAISSFDRGVAGARFVPLLRGYLINALFAAGRLGDADRELEAAVALWPRFVNLWRLRFWTLALTGRLEAALAHISATTQMPVEIHPEEVTAARLALTALATRTTSAIDTALAAWSGIAQRTPGESRTLIGLAANLGRVDDALVTTARFLAPYGEIPIKVVPGPAFLFSAPLAPLRDKPAFWEMCSKIGLQKYWHTSGSRPDALQLK